MHVNVNCSDLARSRAFYEDGLGLTARSHTAPEPQDCSAFGLDGLAAWDAWILFDHRGSGAMALDLLQWVAPTPVGAPAGPWDQGIARLLVAAPDAAALQARLLAHGGGSLDEPGLVTDPDGTVIQVEEDDDLAAAELRGIVVGCTDLDRSVALYQELVGFVLRGGWEERRGDDAVVRSATLQLPQVRGSELRLLQRLDPPTGTRPRPVANQLGAFRTAWLTDDAAADHARWAALGVDLTGPPVWLDMGPQLPIDGLWAVFGFDPDGTCVELIQSVV
jgi:catechol 2,3-dioxygenase-like lactoylglutathione lyase family enzyme